MAGRASVHFASGATVATKLANTLAFCFHASVIVGASKEIDKRHNMLSVAAVGDSWGNLRCCGGTNVLFSSSVSERNIFISCFGPLTLL